MNNEKMNQIIDEAYENYIAQTRIEFQEFCERNPGALVNYREDTKERFLKSIKENKHWFTGEKEFSEKWGLKIEERELDMMERWGLAGLTPNMTEFDYCNKLCDEHNVPTKLITITYKNETIEVYE